MDVFQSVKDITEEDGTTAYFDLDFLIREYNLFDDDALKRNKE
jgi:hypothetical protein